MPQVKPCQPKRLEFARAFKSFMGYLEGTHKAAHTIKNYRLDLLAFQGFLVSRGPGNSASSLRCELLGATDLEQYHQYLKSQQIRTNTRRRKLLTAQRFLRYLSQRKQLASQVPLKMSAPHKIERVPVVVSLATLVANIQALPAATLLDRRNRALLWVLAETGCLVSEATALQAGSFEPGSPAEGKEAARVMIPGKAAREVPVSALLAEEIRRLGENSGKWLFPGHNKHGPLGAPITSRGVELLTRFYAARLGFPSLTPRMIRHSAVVAWFQEGIPQDEIQRRLGLKTPYAFRMYAPLLANLS